MKSLKLGIVVADVEEYKPFCERLSSFSIISPVRINRDNNAYILEESGVKAELYCINCGIGKVNAATAAAHLADLGVDIILNYGLSGGISGVKRGEVIFANRFLEHDFDLTTIGYKPCEKPRQKYIYTADERLIEIAKNNFLDKKMGTAVCGDRFICNDNDRIFFKNEFNAMSCDMETAAIASVADMYSLPFIAMRRISDDAGDEAVESYNDMNETGNDMLCDVFLDFVKAVIKSNKF